MEFITQCGVPAGPIGQGTWYLGNRPDTFQQELSALRAGIDRGMTLLDTAEMYGEGAAERLLEEDPELSSCPAAAERAAELFAQAAESMN